MILHHHGLWPGIVGQNNPFPPKVTFVSYFVAENENNNKLQLCSVPEGELLTLLTAAELIFKAKGT